MSEFVTVVKFTAIDFNRQGDILVFVRSNRPDMTAILWAVLLSPIQIFNPTENNSSEKEKTLQKGLFYCRKFPAILYLSEFPSLHFEALLKTVCVRYRQYSQLHPVCQ